VRQRGTSQHTVSVNELCAKAFLESPAVPKGSYVEDLGGPCITWKILWKKAVVVVVVVVGLRYYFIKLFLL